MLPIQTDFCKGMLAGSTLGTRPVSSLLPHQGQPVGSMCWRNGRGAGSSSHREDRGSHGASSLPVSLPTSLTLGTGKGVRWRQEEEVSVLGLFFSPKLAEGRDWQW